MPPEFPSVSELTESYETADRFTREVAQFRSAAAVPANTRYDVTVLPPERFLDEPMPEQRKRDLLGKRYEASVRAGARNSPTVEGRFGQVCCGWPTPPTPRELYDAIRATEPDKRQQAVFTTWLCESDKWELLEPGPMACTRCAS